MGKIKVEIKNQKVNVLENNTEFVVNGKLPIVFMKYLEVIRKVECESLFFKYSHNDSFYRIQLKQTYNEYIFKSQIIESDVVGKDTDQIFKDITEKYCNLSELTDLDDQISSEKRMILSIFLELKSIKKDLDNADKWREKMEHKIENWQEDLEKEFKSSYLEKSELSLLNLLMAMPRLEMILFITIILGLVIIVDQVNIKTLFDGVKNDPTQLTN
jgi:hypothetical protein